MIYRKSISKSKYIFAIEFLLLFGLSLSLAHADTIDTTAEAAGAVNTTANFNSVGVETFNSGYAPGFNSSITSTFGTQLGSYSLLTGMSATISNIAITPANTYGGAGNTGYYAADYSGSNTFTTTVTLNQNVNYFGLWISAMNNGNLVSLYNGSNLLFQFNSTSMASLVGNCALSANAGQGYCGNPSGYGPQATTDRNEPFAFVNFYDTTGSFNIIKISGNGFESDNYTVGNYTAITGTQVNTPQVIPDIVASNNRTSLNPSGFNLLSNVAGGSTFNNRFDGGTLRVDTTNASTSANFTITNNNGYLDQYGNSAAFTGLISDDGSSHGRLIITNSAGNNNGFISLTNTGNSYSGGTQVQAGAALSIANSSVLGTGGLDLVGTVNAPATLATTASMTISNPITVTGDPIFNVAPNTILTVSSPITDGSSAGYVEVAGGGILTLNAINTYTGNTTVDAGSTLALVGAGSIASSGTATGANGLTNNGNFSVLGKTGNVALGGAYTQSSTGNLLMNVSPSNTQQVNITGAANLAGALTLAATAGTYTAGKYTLITANGVTGTFGELISTLPLYTRLGYALGYDANDVYLYLTPNVADSQQSLVNNASALQNIYTLQNTVLANSFSYDCNVFGENDVCVSAGGRNTAVSAANGLNNTSALLIASYRLDESNSRVGAYADQNLSMNQAGNTVNLGNNTPLMGLFAAWNENADGTGAEVKAGIAYGQKNASVTRQVVGTSEPGTGSSQLNSQGAQITAKYGFALDGQIIVSPYIGMRYTQNNMGGYTEATSASVTSPLTYAALNTNATTALAGVGASYHFIPEVNLFASAGVETDTNTANGTYSATGLAGLTPINFNANPVKTRPTAMLGASYDVEKNQRIGITGIYRQEAFQAVSTTSVMATYTVGF